MQHMPAADGVSGDHCHHRFRAAANLHLQVEHVELRHTRFIVTAVIVATRGRVAARAESFLPGVLEDDHPDAGVKLRLVGGVEQMAKGFQPKGIARLGAIDDNVGMPLAKS